MEFPLAMDVLFIENVLRHPVTGAFFVCTLFLGHYRVASRDAIMRT